MAAFEVRGSVAPGFEVVRDAFAAQLHDLGDGGAAFAAVIGGNVVVDLWAGCAGARAWSRETRAVIMSATKGVAATAVACVVDDGLIDVEAPVASYWPEFAGAGKSEVTVAQLLSHSAGLVTVPGYEELITPDGLGWGRTREIVSRLEAATPAWEPGTRHGYHGVTFGWLTGELVQRVTGTTVGRVVADRIAGPLDIELDLGTPSEIHDVVAPTVLPRGPSPLLAMRSEMPDADLFDRMMLTVDGRNIVDTADRFFAAPGILELELAAQNGTATARALAVMYGTLADEGRHGGDGVLLSPDTIAELARERMHGPDALTGIERQWGLGYQLARPQLAPIWGASEGAFGHDGFGGQIGFADPKERLGVGFVRSHLAWTQSLGPELTKAVYSCLRG
jgi:CubicO group peptidase (beta-lactamase class C family)